MKAILIAALLLLVGCKDDTTTTTPQAIATPATSNKSYEVLEYEYSVIVDKDTCDYFQVKDEREGIFKCSSGNKSFTDSYQNGKQTTHTSTGIIAN